MHPISYSDIFTGANLLVALAFYRKFSIALYQHGLMWQDYAERKGLTSKKAAGAGSSE